MSMKAGEKTTEQKVVEEMTRIATLGYAIKCIVSSGNVNIIREYAEEILMHCDNVKELQKNG